MRSVIGTVESFVSSMRRMGHMGVSPDTRREAFAEEFGASPPYQKASTTEREKFSLKVVQPVLALRAQAVQDGAKGAGSGTPGTDEAFGRAYQVAVDMGLAEKGRTYRDYLDSHE